MAKLAVVLREKKRRLTVAKFKAKRQALLEVIHNSKAADEDRDAARLEAPLGTALVLWICSLPLIALIAILTLDPAAAIAAAGVALVAWVAGCLWASRDSTHMTS